MPYADVLVRSHRVWEHKGLALRARRGRPAWAHSDPVRLGQVVANLVSNAVRHTERGGVLVGVRRRGDAVVVEVVDTGPGIPAEHRDAIFEEFVQLGAGTRDRREGLGLGLAIVRRLCERLGHACTVASTPGRGSRSSVTIARLADPDRPVAAAVAAVDACERGPDVILTDHRLAGAQTGLDVVRRIAASTGQPLPAIVMSADLDASLERRVLEQGAVLLRKPVDPRTLRARIADARRVAIAGAAR